MDALGGTRPLKRARREDFGGDTLFIGAFEDHDFFGELCKQACNEFRVVVRPPFCLCEYRLCAAGVDRKKRRGQGAGAIESSS